MGLVGWNIKGQTSRGKDPQEELNRLLGGKKKLPCDKRGGTNKTLAVMVDSVRKKKLGGTQGD